MKTQPIVLSEQILETPGRSCGSKRVKNLARAALLDFRKLPEAPLPQLPTMRRISQVSEHSPAALAGLARGDYLLSVNGAPANKHHFWRDVLERSQMTYRVWSTQQECVCEIDNTALPFGIYTPKTPEAVLADYRSGRGQYEDLIDLWLESEWSTLKAIGDRWKEPGRFGMEWQARVKGRRPYSWQVEYLFKGVAEYEIGNQQLGMQIIEEFAERDSKNFETVYQAILWSYRAKNNWQSLKRDQAIADLNNAYCCDRLLPIREAFVDFGLEPPPAHSALLGKPFPTDYTLPNLDNIASLVSLESALEHLPDDAIHLVCLQIGNRSNRPYNQLMRRMQTFHRCFPQVFHSMHVIVGNNIPQGWEYHEATARAASVKFTLLLDRLNSVAESIKTHRVPELFGLNNKGEILMHDALDNEVALWDWLGEFLSTD